MFSNIAKSEMENAVTPTKILRQKSLMCSSCAGRLTLPQLIPCVPRCCSDCLQTLTDKQVNVSIGYGSSCKEEQQITEIDDDDDDDDDVKTDSDTSDFVDDTQVQTSSREASARICIGCADNTKVIAYCYKCENYVCESCYAHHVDSNFPTNHRLYTTLVGAFQPSNLTCDKAVSEVKGVFKHPAHPTRISRQQCKTVENESISIPCGISSEHCRSHSAGGSNEIARSERERILASLMFCKDRLYKTFGDVSQAKEKLDSLEIEEKKTFLGDEQRKIEIELGNEEEKFSLQKMQVEARLKTKLSEQRGQLKREIEELRKKFDKMKKVAELDAEIEIKNIIYEYEERKTKLLAKVDILKHSSNKSIVLLESKQKERSASIHKIVEQFESIASSFEEVTSLCVCNSDWRDVQFIPDTSTAMVPSSTQLKTNLPYSQVERLTKVRFEEVCTPMTQMMTHGSTRLTENGKTMINLYKSIPGRWNIDHVSGSNRETVVITGYVSGKNLCHRTVINMEGKPLYQCVEKPTPLLGHTCECIPSSPTEFLFLMSGDIGFYDIQQRNTVKRKHIRDVIKSCVTCAAIDDTDNQIIVGVYNDRKVHVFDFELNHLRAVDVPDIIGYPYDIALHGNSLLICDMYSDSAFAITLPRSGRTPKMLYEFTKPDIDAAAGSPPWWPLSVSIDNEGFVYMLWFQGGTKLCQVVQYTQNGGHVVSKLSVHEKAQHIDIVSTTDGEKLIVSTDENIFVYCLSA